MAAYIGSVLVGVCVALFGNVTLVSTNNAPPDGGVTAPEHVRAIFNINFNIVFKTITCAFFFFFFFL